MYLQHENMMVVMSLMDECFTFSSVVSLIADVLWNRNTHLSNLVSLRRVKLLCTCAAMGNNNGSQETNNIVLVLWLIDIK